MWVAISSVLAIFLVAGSLLLRVAVRLRRRARRVLAAAAVLDRDADRVFDETQMRHRGSYFSDRIPVPEAIAPPGPVQVFATAQALFVGRVAIPHVRIDDAALVSGQLRVRWSADGEEVETWLEAPPSELERLRREIHLRQANVAEKLVSMLGPKP